MLHMIDLKQAIPRQQVADWMYCTCSMEWHGMLTVSSCSCCAARAPAHSGTPSHAFHCFVEVNSSHGIALVELLLVCSPGLRSMQCKRTCTPGPDEPMRANGGIARSGAT